MNARIKIVKILIDVFKNKKFSNVLINQLFKNNDNKEEAYLPLVVNCVYGTIQNKLYFETILSKFIDMKKTKIEAKLILCEALYEKLFLDKPDYAIVYNSVEVAKKINHHFSGMINKVLKSVFSEIETLKNISWITNENENFMIKNSLPFWIGNKIISQYGKEIFEKLAQDINKIPNNYFVVNNKIISDKEFVQKHKDKYEIKKSKISNKSYFMNSSIVQANFFKNNEVYIQDVTSTISIEKLELDNQSKILDMCCAPGGKSILASMFVNKAKIIANDINLNKNGLILSNFKKYSVNNFELILDDALNINEKEKYDAIILDAPCSGFGLIKRKPETKYKILDESYKELIELQSNLLNKAYNLLESGGKLVYSTCTIFKEENEYQINDFLKLHKDINVKYQNQFFGFEENNNGFFICVMTKN